MDDVLPGFRFYPTEEELVSFYLYNKLRGTTMEGIDRIIPVVDIYDYNPWDLPHVGGDGEQWFFFSRRQEREARGGRPNRLTTEGYWKATGSPGDVYSSQNCVIGRKRTMVFYVGRAPNGTKTTWKMNEYKAILSHQPSSSSSSPPPNPQLREELSLCRIYKKSRDFRAFDRRPPPSEAAASGGLAAAQPIMPPSAAESSSSPSNVIDPFQSLENENNNLDSEYCWDYDQLINSFHI